MKTVATTGNIPITQKELLQLLGDAGFTLSQDVKRNTKALLVGKNPKELKIDAARLQNIPIIDLECFLPKLRNKEPLITIPQSPISFSTPSKRSKRKTMDSMSSAEKKLKKLKRSKSSDILSALADMSKETSPEYRSPSNKGHVIAMEGLIGVGKSTLTKKLKNLFPNDCEIYSEETNEQFLQLFYSNPQKYAFSLQWGMLKTRVFQLRMAQHDTQHGRWPYRSLYFWDRSMVGDYTFALLNHLNGGLSSEEMRVYESEFGGSIRDVKKIPFFNEIDLFVFMNDEPANCKHRLENVRKNESESSIPLSYYEGLDDIHFYVFMKILQCKVAKVVIQNWGSYDDPTTTKSFYESLISDKKKLPTLETIFTLPEFFQIEDFIYEDEESILEAYQELSSTGGIGNQKDYYKSIYIPSDIMTISAEEKGYNPKSVEEYGIICYKNEYKRILLWHLSQFQNVYLYTKKKIDWT